MDRVLTINDWWDGPVTGLATYNDRICIYDRIFDSSTDAYGDEYFLTPIGDAEAETIINEWKAWCAACSKNDAETFYKKYPHNQGIDRILEKSGGKNQYRKKAVFSGGIREGWMPVDYYVEWQDI